MGNLCECFWGIFQLGKGKKKKINREHYFNEIFDGLDLNGTQVLEETELDIVLEIYKNKRLAGLEQQRVKLEKLKSKDLVQTYSKSKTLSKKVIFNILRDLHLTDQEIIDIWTPVKEREVLHIKNQLEKKKI